MRKAWAAEAEAKGCLTLMSSLVAEYRAAVSCSWSVCSSVISRRLAYFSLSTNVLSVCSLQLLSVESVGCVKSLVSSL